MSFEEFYNLNYSKSYYFTIKYVVNIHDTEDILAESYIALFEAREKLEELERYFWSILRNKINDFLRRRYKFYITSFDDDLTEECQNKSNNINKRLLTLIDEKIEKMSKLDQQLFDLKYREKISSKEIAQKLRLTVNNVKVRNNRLIKRLKKLCQVM